MRLLRRSNTGEFSLTQFHNEAVPPYAILSHTWGADTEEVTFKDLTNGTGKHKPGYEKIRFCGEQAAEDDLEYIWIDTCCIDKSSSAELSEAINSMFRWYQNAQRCYVYLPDVSIDTLNGNDELYPRWRSAFRKSRWFTRGWTLQELIAPASVEFFSKEKVRLGDKKSLEQTIHEITEIPIEALRGSPRCDFSEDDRFSWAATRQTRREEDEAYCLLGIFDIQMPLLYGEGQQKAMKRLRKEILEAARDLLVAPAHNVQSSSQRQNETADEIRLWLSAPDPSTNYYKALKQRQDDTGLWFLEGDQYTQWKTSTSSLLWLHGTPGCGKTILISTILQDVLQHCDGDTSKAVAYFFFDFNDVQKQSTDLMVRSLICQLLQQCVTIPTSLRTLFSSCENEQRQPSLHALLDVLQQIMRQFPQVCVILDALDECPERAELMDILETMSVWQLQNSHILLASRRERDLESSLETFIHQQNFVDLKSELLDRDIQKYVRQRLSDDKRLSKWGKDLTLRQDIEAALMKGAQGMFRWVVCQLDMLGKCRNRVMLRKSLSALPPTLENTYDRILCAIDEHDSQYAVRILRWLAFSARPLSVDEVAEVVAIDVGDQPKFNRDEVLEDPLDVFDICSSLITITIDEEDGLPESTRQVVVLAHYSVKEYLLSDRIWKGPAARYGMQGAVCHDNIAMGCLGYLLQFQELGLLSQDSAKDFKLAEYSAKFWINHAQSTGERTGGFIQAAMDLLLEKSDAYLNWLRIHDPDKSWEGSGFQKDLVSVPAPLYYSSLTGLRKIVELLLDKGADVNVQGGYYGNPLQAASARGYEQIVKLLLDINANVNVQGGYYGNPLQAASARGYKQIVKLLLNKNADVNAQGGHYGNALQAASAEGHEQIVKLLLEGEAYINAQGGHHGNVLYAASVGGHEQIIKLLLDKNADVNVRGGYYGNALQAASARGYQQIVKLLLDKEADINAQGEGYSNALQAASAEGHEQIVELLLKKGANINAQGGKYSSALQAASVRGHEQVVKLLLDNGANVDAQGGYYGSALQAASYQGYEEVVKLLLDRGANANAQGGEYGNALQAASATGNEQVVKLLFSKGSDVNAQGGYYGNALQAACFRGNHRIVELLLSNGAYVNVRGGRYGTPLYAASNKGNEAIIEQLLAAGADPDAHGEESGGALYGASLGGHLQIVQRLLEVGANVNAHRGGYGSALQAASYGGFKRVVGRLLDAGANVNAQGGIYGTALQAASHKGNQEVVEMLLVAGATVNLEGGYYGYALQAASNRGIKSVLERLLVAGADVNAQGGYYGNALQAASSQGYEKLVEILLKAGANVHSRGGEYGNALHAALCGGHQEVVDLLHAAGAGYNACTRPRWQEAAYEHTYQDIKRLLQDIEDGYFEECSIRMRFECEALVVASLAELQNAGVGHQTNEALLNHIVLVSSPLTDVGTKQTRRMEALQCIEYMRRRWGPLGEQLLKDISRLCTMESGSRLHNVYEKWDHSRIVYSLIFHDSDLLVDIDNTICGHQLGTFMSALNWLCKAIRVPQQRPSPQEFLISSSSCRMSQLDPKGKSKTEWELSDPKICLSFSLFSQPLQEIQNNCWQKLFRSCFILEEDEISECSGAFGKGLEMSFGLMACLAAIEYPVVVQGGIVLVGYHTVLVPTQLESSYVQFHLEVDETRQINPFELYYGQKVQVLDYMQLSSMRCFVGWCESAHIKLGTNGLPVTVRYSKTQERGKTLQLTGLSAGFQLVSASPIQAGINGQATFSFISHQLRFNPASDYSKMLYDTSKDVVLVSDVNARRSWLVPKLSLLLHMAHIWFAESSIPTIIRPDPIPFAEPHYDGSVVIRALEGQGDIVICGRGNDSFKLRSLLLGLSINLLASVDRKTRSKRKSLYGFELMDLVMEPGRGGFMKEVKIQTSQSWLALANLADAVVVCSDLGEAIVPADDCSRKNAICNELPCGQDYLAAHLACLDRFVSRAGGQSASLQQPSRVSLAQENYWSIIGDPFHICNHGVHSTDTCWKELRILQNLDQGSILRHIHSTQGQTGSLSSQRLGVKGAVVFGKNIGRAWNFL